MVLTTGLLLAFSALLFWGITDFLAKWYVDREGGYKTIFYFLLVAVICLAASLPFFYTHVTIPSMAILFILIVAGIIGGFGCIFYYHALELDKVSLMSPFVSGSPVITILLSYLFLREVLSSLQYLSLAILLCGLFMLFFHHFSSKKHAVASGVPYVIAAMLFWGTSMFLGGFNVRNTNWYTTLLFFMGVQFIVLLLFTRIRKISLKLKHKKHMKSIWIPAIFDLLGQICFYAALATEFTSLVVPITSLFPGLTVIFARIFLKEKLMLIQKLGVVVVLVGIFLLSL